jgi:hypothetical protein
MEATIAVLGQVVQFFIALALVAIAVKYIGSNK